MHVSHAAESRKCCVTFWICLSKTWTICFFKFMYFHLCLHFCNGQHIPNCVFGLVRFVSLLDRTTPPRKKTWLRAQASSPFGGQLGKSEEYTRELNRSLSPPTLILFCLPLSAFQIWRRLVGFRHSFWTTNPCFPSTLNNISAQEKAVVRVA